LDLNLVLEGIIFLTVSIWFVIIIKILALSSNKQTLIILFVGSVVLFSATSLDLVGDITGRPELAMQLKNFLFTIGAVLFTAGFSQWSSWTIRNMKRLEHIAVNDELTQLLNRRGFLQCLSKEINRSQRLNKGFVLLVLDLNNFKLINDTYGHPAGDAVLKKIASVMRNEFRSYDILGRIGGDEFAAVLPDSCPENGLKASERIRKAVEKNSLERNLRLALLWGEHSTPLKPKLQISFSL